jgi:hypothetical protein
MVAVVGFLRQRALRIQKDSQNNGVAARTMAAYIDLNPVRAGMVTDPADYRWSSYGEAIGGGAKGNGKKARELAETVLGGLARVGSFRYS